MRYRNSRLVIRYRRVAIASTQTAATLLALGSPGLTVVMPGKEAIALAPLSVSVLDQFEKLSESTQSSPSTQAPKPQAHPIQAGGITRGSRIRPAEASVERPRIACWRS